MATRVGAKFRVPTGARAHILGAVEVPAGAQSRVANDVGETAMLDTGTGDGLDTGDQSELAVGTAVLPTLCLEILVGANTLPGGTALRNDAPLAVETLESARGDIPLAGEVRSTYVIAVTLTLSDGRVITYPVPPAPTS